jgi:hypothetical protein
MKQISYAVSNERDRPHSHYHLLRASCCRLRGRARIPLAAIVQRNLIPCTMHKTPKDIARSLRAFRNAHRLGLLRCVRISPGRLACETAMAQAKMEYLGHAVPRLPLAKCTRGTCECDYIAVGTEKLRRMNANKFEEGSRKK